MKTRVSVKKRQLLFREDLQVKRSRLLTDRRILNVSYAYVVQGYENFLMMKERKAKNV